MPAQLTSGNDVKQLNPKEAAAYCRGLSDRQASGAAIDNPYNEATEKDIFDAYAYGWTYANSLTELDVNNNAHCAVYGAVPEALVSVPDIVGLDAVDADAAIVGAGLVVGTVTGTVDPVASQDPVGGTQVAAGSSVDYALTS